MPKWVLRIFKILDKLMGWFPQKTLVGIALKAVAAVIPGLAPAAAMSLLLDAGDILFFAGILHWRLRDILKEKESLPKESNA